MAAGPVVPAAAMSQRQTLRAAMYGARDSEDIEPLRVALEAGEEVGLGSEDILPAKKLLAELEEQQQPLTFQHVTRAEVERLRASTSSEEVVSLLAKCFELVVSGGPASEILLEYHYQNYAFSQRNRFSVEQTSTFLSLMAVLHTQSIAQGKLPEDQACTLFEAMLSRHSQHLPPYSFEIFPPAEAAKVRDYAYGSFFRHYRMYGYAYLRRAELSVQSNPSTATASIAAAVPFRVEHEVVDEAEVEEILRSLNGPSVDAAKGGVTPSRSADPAASSMGFTRRPRDGSESPTGGYRNQSKDGGDADHDIAESHIEAALAERGLGQEALEERLRLPDE